MPNTDKWPLIQKRYNEPLPTVLARLLNEKGWEGAAIEFDVSESTIGEYMKRCNIHHICVYVVAEQETEKVAS